MKVKYSAILQMLEDLPACVDCMGDMATHEPWCPQRRAVMDEPSLFEPEAEL